jgi:hypothetical protein
MMKLSSKIPMLVRDISRKFAEPAPCEDPSGERRLDRPSHGPSMIPNRIRNIIMFTDLELMFYDGNLEFPSIIL